MNITGYNNKERMGVDTALRHVPTFEEVVKIIETDPNKIKYPDRKALFFHESQAYQTFLENQKALDIHETGKHNHDLKSRADRKSVV